MSWRTLVVDDDVVVAITLSLSDFDVDVTDVARIGEARRALLADQYHVVVVDRRLPDGDGLDLVREIRATPATAALPVIVLTAGHDEADRELVLGAGANDYLPKPIEPEALIEAFERVCGMPEIDLASEEEPSRRRRGLFSRREPKVHPEPPALAPRPAVAVVDPAPARPPRLVDEPTAPVAAPAVVAPVVAAPAAVAAPVPADLEASLAKARAECQHLSAIMANAVADRDAMAADLDALQLARADAMATLEAQATELANARLTIEALRTQVAELERAVRAAASAPVAAPNGTANGTAKGTPNGGANGTANGGPSSKGAHRKPALRPRADGRPRRPRTSAS